MSMDCAEMVREGEDSRGNDTDSYWGPGGSRVCEGARRRRAGEEAVNDVERCEAGGHVSRIVEGEFQFGQEPGPVRLGSVNPVSEEYLQCLDISFGLSIGLGMGGRRKRKVDAKLRHKGCPEMRHDAGVPVRHDRGGETKTTEPVCPKECCGVGGRVSSVCGDIQRNFGQSARHNEDAVEPIRRRERADPVHRNGVEGGGGDREGEGDAGATHRLMLSALAGGAGIAEGDDITGQGGSVKQPGRRVE